jgi:uncharacterized DUF497 family protein
MKPIKVGDTWFDWDERKSERTLRLRGFDFGAAAEAFFSEDAIDEWNSRQGGEDRQHVIADIPELGVLLVVYTVSEYHGEEKIHIVSARAATATEKSRLKRGL